MLDRCDRATLDTVGLMLGSDKAAGANLQEGSSVCRSSGEGWTRVGLVFAIDTFVSSDSRLESKRFADADVGKGFVVRAVNNSNIVPVQYVDRVAALVKENGIARQ